MTHGPHQVAEAPSTPLHPNAHASLVSPAVARLTGSGVAGLLELTIFHPVDTIAKRLMTSKTKYMYPSSPSATLAAVNKIVFRIPDGDVRVVSVIDRFKSLFPGFGFAAGYKISQRIYKFGGQPVIADLLDRRYGNQFRSTFGDKRGRSLQQATAGSLIGIGEALLLPLDVMKIRAQTNPAAITEMRQQKFFSLPMLRSLYAGWQWTAARNAPGSFALFGSAALTYNYLFNLQDAHSATFFQSMIASVFGAATSILVSAPFDVVKTRVQQAHASEGTTGKQVIANLIKHEGLTALFKGAGVKLMVVGPKLVFSFTIAQHIIHTLARVPHQKTDKVARH